MANRVEYETVTGSSEVREFSSFAEAEEFITETEGMGLGARLVRPIKWQKWRDAEGEVYYLLFTEVAEGQWEWTKNYEHHDAEADEFLIEETDYIGIDENELEASPSF